MVGLGFMQNKSHSVSTCNLSSDPLLYIRYWHLHKQILLTNRLMHSYDLSKISSSTILTFLLTVLVTRRLTNGSSTVLNQLEAGSTMVIAMESMEDLFT